MKKAFLLLSAGLLLASCENVNGKLDVVENIVLKDKKGRNVPLQEGTTRALLQFRSRKKLRMTIKDGPQEGKKIDFKIPKGFRLDDRNGTFNLTNSQIAQPFDMSGRVATDTETSDLRHGIETCFETRTVRGRCVERNGERVCPTRTETIEGRRHYTYFFETDHKVFEIDLKKPSTQDKVASFDGTRTESRTVRLHSTPCMTRYRNYRYSHRHCGTYGRRGRVICH